LALASKASPEAHYVLGCLYYQLSRDVLAARHLRKALEMDEDYGEAFYVLALISERAGRKELAEEYFAKAGTRATRKVSTSARSKAHRPGATVEAPLFRLSPGSSRKLITGGDRRLAEALREDALNAYDTADFERR